MMCTVNFLFIIAHPIGKVLSLHNWLKMAFSQKTLENFYIANINIPNHYPEYKNLNFLPTVNNLFKFSAQDSDLEYLFWQYKNFPVSSDLKPPLEIT